MTVMGQVAAPRKRRVFYLDFVRALATVLIVITHFNNPYLLPDKYLFFNQPFGVYIGDWGVSLFLIISGVALTMTYSHPLDLKRFYWKRFVGIYPMFWTAWILGTLYMFMSTGGHPPNAAPAWRFVFTLFGLDGLLANFHIQTMYLLGEWFLGFILLFYVVFPVLLWCIDRSPVITALGVVLVFGVTMFLLRGETSFPKAVILTVRLPELMFGMYFAKYVRRLRLWVVFPASVVLLTTSLVSEQIQGNVATALVGVSSFLVLVLLGRYISIQPVRETVRVVAKYSYPVFLVHHLVISESFKRFDVASMVPLQVAVLAVADGVIIASLAVVLHHLSNQLVGYFSRCFRGAFRRPLTSEAEA